MYWDEGSGDGSFSMLVQLQQRKSCHIRCRMCHVPYHKECLVTFNFNGSACQMSETS